MWRRISIPVLALAAFALLSVDTIGLAAIVLFFAVLLIVQRQRFQFGGFFPFWAARYNTQVGIKTMDAVAKRGGILVDLLGWLAAIVVIPGMLLMLGLIVKLVFDAYTGPNTAQGAALVLPIQGVKGVFYVPLLYWLPSLFVILVVHEFGHGLLCRRYGIKVERTGLFIAAIGVPIIPGAFVEPNAEELGRATLRQKLAVFGAGVLMNGLCAIACWLPLHYAFEPWLAGMQQVKGIEVGVAKGGPAEQAGLKDGDVITSIDGQAMTSPQAFTQTVGAKKPGDVVKVATLAGANVPVTLGEHPQKKGAAFIGISGRPHIVPNPGYDAGFGKVKYAAAGFLGQLFFWLFVLNIGIGAMNLFPGFGIDGHQALVALGQHTFGQKGVQAAGYAGLVFIFLLLALLIRGFLP